MTHPRKLIRAAVVSQLDGKTAAGDRVFNSRTRLLRPNELPALAVYATTEEVDEASYQTAPRELERQLTVSVTGFVSDNGGEELADALDDLAEQIEAALSADDTLGGTASDCVLARTAIDLRPEGDPGFAVVDLQWLVTYHAYMPAGAELDDFETANIRYDLGPEPDGVIEAEDMVHLLGPSVDWFVIPGSEPPPYHLAGYSFTIGATDGN